MFSVVALDLKLNEVLLSSIFIENLSIFLSNTKNFLSIFLKSIIEWHTPLWRTVLGNKYWCERVRTIPIHHKLRRKFNSVQWVTKTHQKHYWYFAVNHHCISCNMVHDWYQSGCKYIIKIWESIGPFWTFSQLWRTKVYFFLVDWE